MESVADPRASYVRHRMARTGEKYTEALRAIEEIQTAVPTDVYKSTSGEPYYYVDSYDHTPYGPEGNVLAYADETDETYEAPLSADADGIDWETLAGKTKIAKAILYTGSAISPARTSSTSSSSPLLRVGGTAISRPCSSGRSEPRWASKSGLAKRLSPHPTPHVRAARRLARRGGCASLVGGHPSAL